MGSIVIFLKVLVDFSVGRDFWDFPEDFFTLTNGLAGECVCVEVNLIFSQNYGYNLYKCAMSVHVFVHFLAIKNLYTVFTRK